MNARKQVGFAVGAAVLAAATLLLSGRPATGSVTAGQIVVGSTNKLWLNDGGDGVLAIGGSTKASAPFHVSALGAVRADDLTSAAAVVDALQIGALGSFKHNGLSGTGNAAACLDSTGLLYRGAPGC